MLDNCLLLRNTQRNVCQTAGRLRFYFYLFYYSFACLSEQLKDIEWKARKVCKLCVYMYLQINKSNTNVQTCFALIMGYMLNCKNFVSYRYTLLLPMHLNTHLIIWYIVFGSLNLICLFLPNFSTNFIHKTKKCALYRKQYKKKISILIACIFSYYHCSFHLLFYAFISNIWQS